MTPSELRSGIRRGEWTATVTARSLPAPPGEYPQWRKDRFAVAIRCACLFLFYDKRVPEITKIVGRERLFEKRELSKQRVAQYIARGCKFFLDRNVFVQVKVKE